MNSSFGVGWRQVAACLVLLMSCAMIASAFSIVAVPLAREFKPSRMVLMLAMTILSAVAGVLSPALGNMMDRLPLRRLMMVGVMAVAAGFVALSFARSIVHVLAIYGVFMAPGMVLLGPIPATVLLSRWFEKRRGLALGIAIAGISLGGFVYPLVIQGLLDAFPWREALRLVALIVVVVSLPAAMMIVDRPSDRGLHPDGADSEPAAVQGTAAAASPLSARAILSDPTFWLVAVVFAVVLSGMKGMVTNLAPLAIDEGISATLAATLISVFSAAGFAAKFAFAAAADKVSPRLLLVMAIVGFSAGMACLIYAEAGYGMLALGVGLIGLFGGFMVPLQSLLIPRIFGPRVVGRASGLLTFVMLWFMLATPPLFGLMHDLTGSYDRMFMILIALAAAVLFLVPRIRMHARDTAEATMGGREAAPAAG